MSAEWGRKQEEGAGLRQAGDWKVGERQAVDSGDKWREVALLGRGKATTGPSTRCAVAGAATLEERGREKPSFVSSQQRGGIEPLYSAVGFWRPW